MSSHRTIAIDRLVDPRILLDRGECPWTFLAFPTTCVDQTGLPTDEDARRYLAAVQSTGLRIGIWLDPPTEGTVYAFVAPADIRRLCDVVEQLESEVFGRDFATTLCERLFRECQAK